MMICPRGLRGHLGSVICQAAWGAAMAENLIPIMDAPLGRHWDQPEDIRLAPMDDTYVILRPDQIQRLPEYSRSFPSGVYPGKCWLRIDRHGRWLGWFGPETPDHKCPFMWREILEVPHGQ